MAVEASNQPKGKHDFRPAQASRKKQEGKKEPEARSDEEVKRDSRDVAKSGSIEVTAQGQSGQVSKSQ